MNSQNHPLNQFSIEELDKELIARGAEFPEANRFDLTGRPCSADSEEIMARIKTLYDQPPPRNIKLSHFSIWQLAERLMELTGRKIIDIPRGIWGDDDRIDYYQITDPRMKRNAESVAAICSAEDLKDNKDGSYNLEVRNYGTVYSLCEREPFHDQPIAAGRICTGFLIENDIIATAGHCLEKDLRNYYFVFGYRMTGVSTPVTRIPKSDVFQGSEIIQRVYQPGRKQDWTLIRLDRKVPDRPKVILSSDELSPDMPVYVIGYPCGLPLKCGKRAFIYHVEKTFFAADLDIYMGNSGSPVFDGNTHKVVGIVIHGDPQDFRFIGNGWLTVIYPNRGIKSKKPQCTRVSQFIQYGKQPNRINI